MLNCIDYSHRHFKTGNVSIITTIDVNTYNKTLENIKIYFYYKYVLFAL